MSNSHFDIKARAHQAATDAGFHPDFSPEVCAEVQKLQKSPPSTSPNGILDLRAILWSSIDNDTSRDLDQIEYVEKLPTGGLKLLIGVADVDAAVPKGSALDKRAATETVSLYTGITTFPMLPPELSNDLTSLVDGQDRRGLVIELRITDNGVVTCHDVYPALLRNHAKLAYNSVAAWLDGRGPIPPAVGAVQGLDGQLRLQLETTKRLREVRKKQGKLAFASSEAQTVVENDEVKDLRASPQNIAEEIIENFMIAGNIAMARYLKESGSISIRRVVKTPKRWDRIQALASEYGVKLPKDPDPRALSDFLDARRAADPDHFPDLSLSVIKMLGPGEYIVEHPGEEHEGHFGLAVLDYTHSTAPNRRYSDLVTQRLLKAAAAGKLAPYSEQELAGIAAHCTERSQAARSLERLMRKVAAAILLSRRIGETFDGIITGKTPKGTFARLLKFPAEGMVVAGAQNVDVGDKVCVRLRGVDAYRGYIDLEIK